MSDKLAKALEKQGIPAAEQLELLNLALDAAMDCLTGLVAMNGALARNVAECEQQIAASMTLITRITGLANAYAQTQPSPRQHSAELRSILLATNEDFSSAVDFNAWKKRHATSTLAASFVRRHQYIAPAAAVAQTSSSDEKDCAAAELIMQEEGGH
jgi:hypothetical protein